MSSREPEGSNYRIDLSYDGRAYYGWQRHGGKPTVQGALEDAITASFAIHSALCRSHSVPARSKKRTAAPAFGCISTH